MSVTYFKIINSSSITLVLGGKLNTVIKGRTSRDLLIQNNIDDIYGSKQLKTAIRDGRISAIQTNEGTYTTIDDMISACTIPSEKYVVDNEVEGATTLAGLTDTTISSPASDEILQYNGSKWVNATLSTASTISELTDTDISGLATNDLFFYDGSNWANGAPKNILTGNATNTIGGVDNFIIGGTGNTFTTPLNLTFSGIIGGDTNTIINSPNVGQNCVIIGGKNHTITTSTAPLTDNSAIIAGTTNTVNSPSSCIFGGTDNVIASDNSGAIIIGGDTNNVESSSNIGNCTIIGGGSNSFTTFTFGSQMAIFNCNGSSLAASSTTLVGVKTGSITGSSQYSAIIAGQTNSISSSENGVIAGGINNAISGSADGNAILGGVNNTISGSAGNCAIIAGGGNTVSGPGSAAIASSSSTAATNYGLVTGLGSKTGANYQFVCGQYNVQTASAYLVVGKGTADGSRSNAFVVYDSGNVRPGGVYEAADGSAGATGSFTASGGETVTVVDGIITSIV